MRRVRLRTGPTALFGAVLLVALLAFLPLRVALGMLGLADTGFTARQASGSVWAGTLGEARFGDLALGDLDAHLSPWPLLVGRARVDLAGRAAAPPFRGALRISRHSLGVDDVTATLPAGRIFEPVPVFALDLDDVTVHFRDDACEAADGRVRATLSGSFEGVPLGEALTGTARCDAGALLLPLASTAGQLRLWNDGRFSAALTLRPSDPAIGAKLEQTGFRPGPGGYQLSVEGHL